MKCKAVICEDNRFMLFMIFILKPVYRLINVFFPYILLYIKIL